MVKKRCLVRARRANAPLVGSMVGFDGLNLPAIDIVINSFSRGKGIACVPPTRFFKHPPFPAIGLLFLVVNKEGKWEESALCVTFATTVSVGQS